MLRKRKNIFLIELMTLNGPHHSSNLFTLYKISSLIFHIYKKWLFDLIKTLFTFYRSSPLYMFFKYNLSMHQLPATIHH